MSGNWAPGRDYSRGCTAPVDAWTSYLEGILARDRVVSPAPSP